MMCLKGKELYLFKRYKLILVGGIYQKRYSCVLLFLLGYLYKV